MLPLIQTSSLATNCYYSQSRNSHFMQILCLYLQLFVGAFMSYLHYLCLVEYSGVQHILCFLFCVSSYLCTLCCQFLFYCPSLISSDVYLSETAAYIWLTWHIEHSIDVIVGKPSNGASFFTTSLNRRPKMLYNCRKQIGIRKMMSLYICVCLCIVVSNTYCVAFFVFFALRDLCC